MAERQIIGDTLPLGKKPISSPSANPAGGSFQIVGDEIRLGKTPVPSPSANPSEGQRQIIGDGVTLSRTPVKGWGNAASLPMSERAIAQSQGKTGKK